MSLSENLVHLFFDTFLRQHLAGITFQDDDFEMKNAKFLHNVFKIQFCAHNKNPQKTTFFLVQIFYKNQNSFFFKQRSSSHKICQLYFTFSKNVRQKVNPSKVPIN